MVTTEAKPDAPEAPTTTMAVKWAIDRVQKKDIYEMFRHPVTEAVVRPSWPTLPSLKCPKFQIIFWFESLVLFFM